jgi:endogenous inhibitor of DNA gyrase (YacG/DUF329 family)
MTPPEQQRPDRLPLTIPVRVMGFETVTGDFSEDTYTSVVAGGGARIVLRRRVAIGDTVRIINLQNYSEADFRVVGPTSWTGSEVHEWGVECQEPGRNVWGVELSSREEVSAQVECRTCHKQAAWALTPMELEVLDTAGIIQRPCDQCAKPTLWIHADPARRPKELPPAEAIAPPAPAPAAAKPSEKRKDKRMGMKLPVLVRGPGGEEEVSKTENLSKGGLAVSLAMELAVGDVVSVVCPYTPGSQDIPQKAEVRRRATYSFGGRREYGFQYSR